MLKKKNLKKLTSLIIVFAFVASLVPAASLFAEEETVVSSDNPMLHFVIKARWGNVIGEPTDVSETNFDGSVSVSNDAAVSLKRTLLFDQHKEGYDKIVSEKNPVSWNSLIYGHWDGVEVVVSAPASSSVIITAGNEQISKTAEELYNAKEPIVADVNADGKELVADVYPVAKNPNYFIKVFWGKIEREGYGEECLPDAAGVVKCKTPLMNADGSLKIDSAGKLKLIKTLRFEWPDKINSKSDAEIAWTSRLYGGVDGILVKLELNADELDKSDTVTINFTNHQGKFPRSYSIIDIYHNKLTKDVISKGYGVAFQVWQRPDRTLIRVKDKPTVYMLEDGVKEPIQSPAVLSSQGLSFDEVETVDQDEADTYADGDPVNYTDGTIVREENNPEVYVIANGEKKHILDPNAFAGLGYNWNNVVVVPPKSLGIFRTAAAMKSDSVHPEGALVRVQGNPKVYAIEGGKKVPIADIQLFNARKYDWSKVVVVNENQAKKFDTGSSLKYPDGSLLKAANGKVYKIDGGKKRWIRTAEDFTKGGYKENKVLNVDNTAINEFDEGTDIMVDDTQ